MTTTSSLEFINIETSNIVEMADICNDNFEILQYVVENTQYLDMKCTVTSNPSSPVEIGSVVNKVVLNWQYNKLIREQSINDVPIASSVRTYTHNERLSSNKSFTIKSKDSTKEISTVFTFTFSNSIYYGVSSETTGDSTLINGLTKKLSTRRNTSFTVNASSSQYIYYALPTNYGTPVFSVGGFEGGFIKVATVQHTNSQGYTESYDIWRSTNKGLGNTTVNVN